MKKVYTSENRMILYNLRNLLEGEGIATRVVNEFSGGGVGDLPAFDTWPELWVEDESRFERAAEILRGVLDETPAAPWFCRACGENNEASFEICWKCGNPGE